MIKENDLFEDQPDAKEIKARRMKNERIILRIAMIIIISAVVLLVVSCCVFLLLLIMYGEHC